MLKVGFQFQILGFTSWRLNFNILETNNTSSLDILGTLFDKTVIHYFLILPFHPLINIPTPHLIYKVWQSIKIILGIQGYTRYTLLWANREFF